MSASVDVNHLNFEGKKATNTIAMVMTMVSFSMLFAALFMGYAIYRATSQVWPPMGMQRVDLLIPTVSSAVILLSSLTYFLFEKNFVEEKLSMARTWLFGTMALGLAFVAVQFRLWGLLQESGIFVDTGIFASIIYGFTWIHAAHMVLGLAALAYLLPTLKGGKDFIFRIQNVGKFWHFLGLVWMIMYFTIFVF